MLLEKVNFKDKETTSRLVYWLNSCVANVAKNGTKVDMIKDAIRAGLQAGGVAKVKVDLAYGVPEVDI